MPSDAEAAISEVVLAGQAPLVLGGECTLAIALVAALVEHLDALDLPLADIATYGAGLLLDHVAPLLRTLVTDPRVVGITIVEANLDHDPEGTSIRRL